MTATDEPATDPTETEAETVTSQPSPDRAPVVVVTGANGLVGAHVCAALLERGAQVRALVRRAGAAPAGTQEHVGDFTDPASLGSLLDGVDAVVTTVHPMGSDRATQVAVGIEGTTRLAEAARDAGVPLLVHVSTCAVYDRSPGTGDVDEGSALVGEDAGTYAVTKRDLDAALAGVDGLTRVLVRPPAIVGSGETSVWNTINPTRARDDAQARHANPAQTWAWVHVTDLAALLADVAAGVVAAAAEPDEGPVTGGCTVVDVAGEPATNRDYTGTVCRALGVDPVWDDGPAWTGQILTDRARAWGWAPQVGLADALAEVERDVATLRG